MTYNCKNGTTIELSAEDLRRNVDDGAVAFLVNKRYVFAALRTNDGSWFYTFVENDKTLIDSGRIGDENTPFISVIEHVLEACQFSFSNCNYEKIPWPAALMILELYYGNEWEDILGIL